MSSVYLDNILVFSDSLEEHFAHVRLVLQWLLENRLFVKAEKCEFHWSTVQFLGFVVSRGRIEMDPAKTEAVVSWPPPTNRKELAAIPRVRQLLLVGLSADSAPRSNLYHTYLYEIRVPLDTRSRGRLLRSQDPVLHSAHPHHAEP